MFASFSFSNTDIVPIILGLVIGMVFIVFGILGIYFRNSLYNWTVRQQERRVGKNITRLAARHQRPFWIGFYSLLLALFGFWAFAISILRLLD
jgi:hypothetical protein